MDYWISFSHDGIETKIKISPWTNPHFGCWPCQKNGDKDDDDTQEVIKVLKSLFQIQIKPSADKEPEDRLIEDIAKGLFFHYYDIWQRIHYYQLSDL